MLLDASVLALQSLHKSSTDFTGFISRWAIPVCMLFLYVYMRTRYHWTQLLVRFLLAGIF